MSNQKTMKLYAIHKDGSRVKPHESFSATDFTAENVDITVSFNDLQREFVQVKTANGTYTLHKHSTNNMYMGICNGVKVHVCLKKITGKLIYWAFT